MSNTMETFDSVWGFCTTNQRVAPMPKRWNELYQMLEGTRQKPSGGWEPSAPLILGAWGHTTPIEKQLRFKEHIQWAFEHGQLEQVGKYLRSLTEEEWLHSNE